MYRNLTETVLGRGHSNILATHKVTLEFTKEPHLTQMGDCIVAVGTDRAGADFGGVFRQALMSDNARLKIVISAGEVSDIINAWGSSRLTLAHEKDLVVRKSDFVCGRTLAVRADKAAKDLDRSLVERLRDPKQQVRISLTISL